jgi:proline iminopeptidase
MSTAFSSLQAYDEGMLETGDGNLVAWEVRGNPGGKPALIIHGGPGGGRPKGTPKSFDPDRYRIILFDQRGCGRSTPHASDPTTDMSLNTTEHLLQDIEQLRVHLEVDSWLLFGGSWGAALALAYAQRHPQRVTEMVLPALWTMTSAEIDWLYRGGVAPLFPEQWEQFRNGVADLEPGGDLVAAYAALMEHPQQAVRAQAALDWVAWEDAVLSLEPHGQVAHYGAQPDDDRIAFVHICTHYAKHGGWMPGRALLDNAERLHGIPGVIIHGRHDLSCPMATAWSFAKAWPDAELVIIDDAGHKGSAEMGSQVRAAIQRFAPDKSSDFDR